MYQRSKDRSLMIKEPCASSSDMEMRSSSTSYGIQRSKRQSKAETSCFMNTKPLKIWKNLRSSKLTYEGVADLTPKQTSSESATNEVEMSESEPRTKLEEPVIEEEESGDDSDMGGIDQGEQIPPLEEGPQLRWTTKTLTIYKVSKFRVYFNC